MLLANSLTSGEQEQVATDLALDFVMTARRFERLGATRETVRALETLASAYDRLATATRVRDAAAYAAATEAAAPNAASARSLRAMPELTPTSL